MSLLLHPAGTSEISDIDGDIYNFRLFAFHVSLRGFQILNGGHFTGDITDLILAIIIVYYCSDQNDMAIFQVFSLEIGQK